MQKVDFCLRTKFCLKNVGTFFGKHYLNLGLSETIFDVFCVWMWYNWYTFQPYFLNFEKKFFHKYSSNLWFMKNVWIFSLKISGNSEGFRGALLEKYEKYFENQPLKDANIVSQIKIFTNISVRKVWIFMKLYVVVNYYLVSLNFKFHEDSCITACAWVVKARAHVLSQIRAFTTPVRTFMHGSAWNLKL